MRGKGQFGDSFGAFGVIWRGGSQPEPIKEENETADPIREHQKPKARSDTPFGLNPVWMSKKLKESNLFHKENSFSLYGKKTVNSNILGTRFSVLYSSLFLESMFLFHFTPSLRFSLSN